MPRINPLGDRIIPASVAAKLLAQLPAAKTAAPPIQAARYARNGLVPDVALINAMNEQTNQSVLYRTKEVFRACPSQYMLYPLPSSVSSTRARWRFAFHTGPYTHAVKAIACMVPQDSNPGNNAYARLDLATNAAGTPAVGSVSLYYGTNSGGTASVPAAWESIKVQEGYIGVSPNTTYYGTWYDIDQCRLISACVHEYGSMTEHFNGYLSQSLAAGSDVLDKYRADIVEIQYNLWRRGGAHVLNWTVDGDDAGGAYGTPPLTTTSGTAKNIIDDTSTTISAATPGYTLDMRYKNRVSQTSGVPCIMQVYGSKSGTQDDGEVYLKDSAGNTIASVTNVFTSTAQWHSSGVFNLPATVDKYDIQYARAGIVTGTFTLYAVSIYEYES